jgi:hemoglobin
MSEKQNFTPKQRFGTGDASFVAAGGETGLIRLVDDFYQAMATLPEARTIRKLHPTDLTESRDKLSRFLSGWLNGPNTFQPKYGPISIPRAHHHLPIGVPEMEAWLACMKHALDKQPYAADFKIYMLDQLRRPAQRCRTR